MVQNNKVLTVSYGTFSCTLEGFDDSFETMKAIAEYFRDLSADDRYFGSEPPQPDAEMLTRIAKRNVTRQVESSQDDTGLLLRANTPPSGKPDARARSAYSPPHAAPETETEGPAADSIAAKLQRIRAVVSHSEENSIVYAEDEETSIMHGAAAPTDAVAAAFKAGSLSPSDLAVTDETAVGHTEALTETKAAPPEVEDTLPVPAEPTQTEPESTDPIVTAKADIPHPKVTFTDIENDTEVDENTPSNQEADHSTAAEEVAEDPENGFLSSTDEQNVLNDITEVELFLARRAADTPPEATNVDHDVSRLMEQADVQMDDPDTHSQRETYSRLRAAVAATEAERGGDATASNDATQADYRELTATVSPRRPEVKITNERPRIEAQPPLKLIAEQRVDTALADAGPVTPRRVTSESDKQNPEEAGFAQFAQDQGAQSLPDLLEAAAAYLSFIEGQEQFSRPQLMNKIRSLKQDDFNREESLRTFGQLLRDGKIEKAGGGRFAASTDIGFRPNDERAAG